MRFLFVLLLLIVAAGFFAVNLSLGVFDDLFSQIRGQKATEVFEDLKRQIVVDLSLQELEKEVSVPLPLRIVQSVFGEEAPASVLSAEGVLQWTNTHRQTAGLNPLERSFALDQIAERKVQDMFALQYFAHISPQGIGVADVAKDTGYEFIAIGENLALGNYEDDETLVQAWMDSPGHRANILGARYQEIGIALQKGLYEGNSTWLAVQTFAMPLSACDSPDEVLKEEIERGKIQIEELGAAIEQMRSGLEAYHPKMGPGYNKKVGEYNALVDQHNTLVAEIQGRIAHYNIQAGAFNECAK